MSKTTNVTPSLRAHKAVFYVLVFLLAVSLAMLVVQWYGHYKADQDKSNDAPTNSEVIN